MIFVHSPEVKGQYQGLPILHAKDKGLACGPLLAERAIHGDSVDR